MLKLELLLSWPSYSRRRPAVDEEFDCGFDEDTFEYYLAEVEDYGPE